PTRCGTNSAALWCPSSAPKPRRKCWSASSGCAMAKPMRPSCSIKSTRLAASGSVVCRNKNGTHAASRPFLIIFVVAFAITQLAQPTRPSGANSVIYALLGEARFGRAGELLLGSLGRTGGRRVLFAFRHKALKCRAGKLLVGSLAFARRVLSEG